MRTYLPAKFDDLQQIEGETLTLKAGTIVYGVSLTGKEHYAEHDINDDEELEYLAFITAGVESLYLLAQDLEAKKMRVVISLDIAETNLKSLADATNTENLWGFEVIGDLKLPVACLHIDEEAARQQIEAAFSGEQQDLENLIETDLLWFDISELDQVLKGSF